MKLYGAILLASLFALAIMQIAALPLGRHHGQDAELTLFARSDSEEDVSHRMANLNFLYYNSPARSSSSVASSSPARSEGPPPSPVGTPSIPHEDEQSVISDTIDLPFGDDWNDDYHRYISRSNSLGSGESSEERRYQRNDVNSPYSHELDFTRSPVRTPSPDYYNHVSQSPVRSPSPENRYSPQSSPALGSSPEYDYGPQSSPISESSRDHTSYSPPKKSKSFLCGFKRIFKGGSSGS